MVRRTDRTTGLPGEIPPNIPRKDIPREMISSIDLSGNLANRKFRSYEKFSSYVQEMDRRGIRLKDIRTVSTDASHRGVNRIRNDSLLNRSV